MFDNIKVISNGVNASVNHEIQVLIWKMIDMINSEKDYLQVFELEKIINGRIKVVHTQEVPEYKNTAYIVSEIQEDQVKIFVIDEGSHCTMLLDREY